MSYWTEFVADAYQAQAQAHRPTDPAQIRTAVRALLSEGLKAQDIGEALGVRVDVIVRLVAEVRLEGAP
jgi:hypothetical protein